MQKKKDTRVMLKIENSPLIKFWDMMRLRNQCLMSWEQNHFLLTTPQQTFLDRF